MTELVLRPASGRPAYQDRRVRLDGFRIVYRNLGGVAKTFNEEGQRNFSIVLDHATAERLRADRWAVKTKPGREEGDEEFHTLPVKVQFAGSRPPKIVLITRRGQTPLDEELVELVDWADIEFCDILIRPNDWTVNGNSGRKAYLDTLMVVLHENPLEIKYEHLPQIDITGNPLGIEQGNQTPELESGTSTHFDYEGEVVEDVENPWMVEA